MLFWSIHYILLQMKKKRIIVLLAMALLCFALPGISQTSDTLVAVQPAHKAKVLADRLEREINLTAKQKNQAYLILLDRSNQWEKEVIPVNNAASKQVLITRVNDETLKKLQQVLTKEQLSLYRQLREELKKQKVQHHSGSKTTEEDLEMDF